MTGLAARREGAFVQAEGRRGRAARHGAGWCFKKTGLRVAWGLGGALGYMLRRRASKLFYSTEGAKAKLWSVSATAHESEQSGKAGVH